MNKYEEEAKIAKELGVSAKHVCVVGSTLICGSGNDVDFLCLVPSDHVVEAAGFYPDIELSYESPLRSFRREGKNIIATTDQSFFFAEVAIANAARVIAIEKFDMSDREDRIKFHGKIREKVLERMGECF